MYKILFSNWKNIWDQNVKFLFFLNKIIPRESFYTEFTQLFLKITIRKSYKFTLLGCIGFFIPKNKYVDNKIENTFYTIKYCIFCSKICFF